MTRPDWIGIAGIILTLIFGIPSIPAFSQGNIALGAVILVLAAVMFGLTVYAYWLLTRSPYTVMTNDTRIEILDASGENTRLRKNITLVPNHSGHEHYTYRNFSCDGTIEDVRVDPAVTLIDRHVSAGDHFITVRFSHQLPRFRPISTWIEFDLKDCFTGNAESCITIIDQPTKAATIDVLFPDQRLPHAGSVKAIYHYSGKDEELPRPSIAGSQITWKLSNRVRNLRYGEYEIMWNW